MECIAQAGIWCGQCLTITVLPCQVMSTLFWSDRYRCLVIDVQVTGFQTQRKQRASRCWFKDLIFHKHCPSVGLCQSWHPTEPAGREQGHHRSGCLLSDAKSHFPCHGQITPLRCWLHSVSLVFTVHNWDQTACPAAWIRGGKRTPLRAVSSSLPKRFTKTALSSQAVRFWWGAKTSSYFV